MNRRSFIWASVAASGAVLVSKAPAPAEERHEPTIARTYEEQWEAIADLAEIDFDAACFMARDLAREGVKRGGPIASKRVRAALGRMIPELKRRGRL